MNDEHEQWFQDIRNFLGLDEFGYEVGSMANDHLHISKRLGDEMLPPPKRARNSVSIESFTQDPVDQIFDNI